jgi:hypothetical protein
VGFVFEHWPGIPMPAAAPALLGLGCASYGVSHHKRV